MKWPTAEFIEKSRRRGRDDAHLPYSANPYIALFGYTYLMHKYKSNCFVPTDVALHYQSGVITQPADRPALAREMLDCVKTKGTRVIFLRLTLNVSPTESHANVLIYRPFQNAIERYEPHGRETRFSHADEAKVNLALAKLFEVEFRPILKEFTPTYYPPYSVCPENMDGFQLLDDQIQKHVDEGPGYCQMWGLFMVETILMNPTMSTKAILEKCLKVSDSDPGYVSQLIRGYVLRISDEMRQYFKANRVVDSRKLFAANYQVSPATLAANTRIGAKTARKARATSPTERTAYPVARGLTVAQLTKIDKKVRKLTNFDARTYLMHLKGVGRASPLLPPKGTQNYRRRLRQAMAERRIPWEELERPSPEVANATRALSPTGRQVQKLSNYDAYKYFLRLSGDLPATPMPKLDYRAILRGELTKRGMAWADLTRQFYGDSETSSLAPQESNSLEGTPEERSPLVLQGSSDSSYVASTSY